MSALDLKPCPFCGKPAELTENEYSAPMVACEWCLARACSHSESLAIDKWNRRPGEDALRARAEAAEAERDALRARALIADQWRAFALEVALQVAPLGEEQRAAQTTVRDLPAVAEALREVVTERDRADQRADRAYAYKVVAENEAAALRARAEAAEAAVATARAEGAAAERAAVVACLHGGADAHSGFGRSVVAVALRDHAAYIEAGAHVRPAEGA
jgi:hypothetical protein